jgi:hypothetical protein
MCESFDWQGNLDLLFLTLTRHVKWTPNTQKLIVVDFSVLLSGGRSQSTSSHNPGFLVQFYGMPMQSDGRQFIIAPTERIMLPLHKNVDSHNNWESPTISQTVLWFADFIRSWADKYSLIVRRLGNGYTNDISCATCPMPFHWCMTLSRPLTMTCVQWERKWLHWSRKERRGTDKGVNRGP